MPYEILKPFTYSMSDVRGEFAGEFQPGVTGADLTDDQAYVLENLAIPQGLAKAVDAPAAPAKPAAPPAAAPSDSSQGK